MDRGLEADEDGEDEGKIDYLDLIILVSSLGLNPRNIYKSRVVMRNGDWVYE